MPPAHTHHNHWASNAIGIALVILGVVTILGALQNHRVYVRSLPAQDVPTLPMPWLSSLLAVAMVAIGLLLAVYLVIA
jgi:putative membrane protein